MSLQTGIDSLATHVANYFRDTVWPAINAKFDKTGGTLTGPVVLTGQASPANPAAGTLAIFAKTDDKLYTRTSAGVEAELGAGGAPADGSITNAKLTDMAANTIKGRLSSLGVPQDLTAANVKTILALSKTDVGLANVDNTSNATERAAVATLTNKTLVDPVITGAITEDVFTITDAAGFSIDPTNGSIQLVTLGANRTPVATNFAAGESVTLMIADGTAFTITWTTVAVTWVGGTAPTLATTGYTVIELWKVGSIIYGSHVGNVA